MNGPLGARDPKGPFKGTGHVRAGGESASASGGLCAKYRPQRSTGDPLGFFCNPLSEAPLARSYALFTLRVRTGVGCGLLRTR